MNPQPPVNRHREAVLACTERRPLLHVPSNSPEFQYQEVAAVLGCERYAEVLYHASYKSARFWCEKEVRAGSIGGMPLFERYLHRLSRRGWGRFSLIDADAGKGIADIRLDYSPFLRTQGDICAFKTCCRFSGWFAGMLDWVAESTGRPIKTACRETRCGADGHSHCIFSVRPRATT